MKLNLNNNQAIRAGICFVNMFGIHVKDEEIMNNGDTLAYPLYNKDKTIGYISIQNKKVKIRAKNDEFELLGYYDIPYASGMEDLESGFAGIVFADWKSNIECAIRTKNGMDMRGDIILSCSGDLEFGTKCTIHSDLNIANSRLGDFNFRINNRGYNFYYCNQTKQDEEKIEIQFLMDRICHMICSDFDENAKWNTRTLDGVISAHHEELRCYNRVQKRDSRGYINDFQWAEDTQPLIGKDGDIERLIQLGNEAQRVAPKMLKRIQQIRECLKFNNTYFFDYLVNAMFNEEELTKATFGYIPQNVTYQNGETNLKDAYFGDFSQNKNLLGK